MANQSFILLDPLQKEQTFQPHLISLMMCYKICGTK